MPGQKRKEQEQSRGFGMIAGKTILSVDTTAINDVILTCNDGRKYSINADTFYAGIPVLECVEIS